MQEIKVPLKVGDTVSFTKTVSESDVYLFAGITGDFSYMHTNEEFMKKTIYKTRMVHGALTFCIGVTTTTLIQTKTVENIPSVSYGFDKLRFINPVFFGDTLTANYTITKIDDENLRSYGKLEIYNQNNEIVCAAQHSLKFFGIE